MTVHNRLFSLLEYVIERSDLRGFKVESGLGESKDQRIKLINRSRLSTASDLSSDPDLGSGVDRQLSRTDLGSATKGRRSYIHGGAHKM